MDWGSIILALIGSGVISTIVTAIFDLVRQKREQRAKERERESKTDTIDIDNFHKLIEEEREERALLRKEYSEYKEEVNKRVAEVKEEMRQEREEMRREREEMRQENNDMMSAILQGYRCRLPAKPDDCPVIKRFKECANCPNK